MRASSSPASITGTGSSTLTFTVGASTTPGTYSVTVSGTSGSTVETTTVSLTVTAPFTLQPQEDYISTYAGGDTTYTVSTTVADGFDSPVTLSASGLPAGVSVSFSSNPPSPLPSHSS